MSRTLVTSVAEAEKKGFFQNVKLSLPIHHILIVMNHPQLPTHIATDNTIATDFFYNNMVMKKSKSWDMNLHWLRNKEAQKYFELLWEKVSLIKGVILQNIIPPSTTELQEVGMCEMI